MVAIVSGQKTAVVNNQHPVITVQPKQKHGVLVGATQGIQGLQGVQGVQGVQGIQGVKGDRGIPGVGVAFEKFNFSFGDASPAVLQTYLTGELIQRTEIVIETAFDIPVSLSVGSDVNPELLFPTDAVDTQFTATYQSNDPIEFIADTQIKLFIASTNISSMGSGYVLIYR